MAWQVPEMKRLMAHRSCKIAVVDQCMFYTPWKKPTKLVGWNVSDPPAPLVQRCRGKSLCCKTLRPHLILEGSRRTALAQAYPWGLAEAGARWLITAAD
eukprot:9480003-Pyramimonas_sp.AAC.1